MYAELNSVHIPNSNFLYLDIMMFSHDYIFGEIFTLFYFLVFLKITVYLKLVFLPGDK